METQTRGTPPPVAEREAEQAPDDGVYGALFREGYAFDFYQAVRLLERRFSDAPPPGETTDYRRERIRLVPDVALVFPATDVKRVEWRDTRARVVASFMGLYGIDSPLPYYFYDDLATEEPDTFALRDFLDLFNHRLYAFFYRAWKKYRPTLAVGDRHARRFLSLAGLGLPKALDRAPVSHPMRMAAFAGRLGARARNVEGLEQLLASLLGVDVRLVENVPRWVRITPRPHMGATDGFTLGANAPLGERVFDVAGKFRLVLGPLSLAAFRSYLPGAEGARRLDYLVRLYAPDYLDYDVHLLLKTAEIPSVTLGDGGAKMGLNTWLGAPADPVTARTVAYA